MSNYDWKDLSDRLVRLLRIKSTPVGMQFFEKKEELDQIPKIRYAEEGKHFSVCMRIGQAVQFNWTVAVLPGHIHSDYCRTIHGLFPKDERYESGGMFAGVWHKDAEESAAHNNALFTPDKPYEAMAVSPLSSGRLPAPDICLLYLTPGQLFLLLSGYLYEKHELLDFTFVGESTCADGWIRCLKTGKPSVSIPCFAERKFAGVADEEMALSMTPAQLVRAIEGTEMLSKSGLRYPIAPYSLSCDMLGGLPKSYLKY